MKKSPLISISVKYGLIAAALAILMLIATFYFGNHPMMVAPYLDFRIILFGLFMFFGLREFRDTQEGVLYFWQGMIGGFVIVTVAGTVAALGLLIFSSVEKEFISSYVEAMTQYLKTFPKEDIERIGKEVYERNLEQLPSTNGKQLASLYFVQAMMIGLFVTIILSVILRKQPKS
jgi:hypothetical protein